jgi:cytosine deaminase
MVTWNSARTMALGPAYDIAQGNPANLVVLDAQNRFDAIRRRIAPRYVISRGRVIMESQPGEMKFDIGAPVARVL